MRLFFQESDPSYRGDCPLIVHILFLIFWFGDVDPAIRSARNPLDFENNAMAAAMNCSMLQFSPSASSAQCFQV
jgi:hypothetical protein